MPHHRLIIFFLKFGLEVSLLSSPLHFLPLTFVSPHGNTFSKDLVHLSLANCSTLCAQAFIPSRKSHRNIQTELIGPTRFISPQFIDHCIRYILFSKILHLLTLHCRYFRLSGDLSICLYR